MTIADFPKDRGKGALAVQASREFMRAANRLEYALGLDADGLEYLALIYESEDESRTQEEREQIVQQLAEAEELFLARTDAFARMVKKMEGLITVDDDELAKLTARRDRKREAVKRMKARMQERMERLGLKRLETPFNTLRIQKNSILTVVVEDESKVPAAFQKVTYTVSKTAIAAHVKETGEIPDGVSVVHGSHLVIA